MIPEAAVEAAAEVAFNRHGAKYYSPMGAWADLEPRFRTVWIEDARQILEAAAPHLLTEAWQEGYMCSYDQERGGSGEMPIPVPEYLADDLVQWNPYRPTR